MKMDVEFDNGLRKAHGEMSRTVTQLHGVSDSMYACAQSIIDSQKTEIEYLKAENARLLTIIADARALL